MSTVQGDLRKMSTQLGDVVQYELVVGDEKIALNSRIGQKIQLSFTGKIHCVQCGRKTKKSFQQGHCFVCMRRINECNNCILFPERCLVEQGNCPHDDWAHRQCRSGQIVYLSNTSGLKVGITRDNQIPTRWIDQGAMQAIPLFYASNRYKAGLMEVAMKSFVADKTNWRVMLKQDSVSRDMEVEKQSLLERAALPVKQLLTSYSDDYRIMNEPCLNLMFPVGDYPKKVSSLSLDKTAEIEGVLLGIKGQYIILDHGVLNIRKFGGYNVVVSFL